MKPKLINLKMEQLPDEVRGEPELVGAILENECYCVISKFGEDDYSVWETDDISHIHNGTSLRGSKDDVIEEIKDLGLKEALTLLD